MRTEVSDFIVTELIDIPFQDSGEHLYLQIEKTDINTQDVHRLLATHYQVPKVDVAFAGMKDKRAIATQWFSVRLPKTSSRPTHENFRVLEERKHSTKLRKGMHVGNCFDIVIRNLCQHGNLDTSSILKQAFPNYFGPQRFGHMFNNLRRAREWIAQGRPHVARFERGLHISTLRSFVFNSVLAERIRRKNWRSVIEGDLLHNGFPTGPMWGRGRLNTSDEALKIEELVRDSNKDVCDALEWVGLQQDRRVLAVQANDVQADLTDSTVRVRFTLPVGSYATVALNEHFELTALRH